MRFIWTSITDFFIFTSQTMVGTDDTSSIIGTDLMGTEFVSLWENSVIVHTIWADTSLFIRILSDTRTGFTVRTGVFTGMTVTVTFWTGVLFINTSVTFIETYPIWTVTDWSTDSVG
jgi:hypothetical protein